MGLIDLKTDLKSLRYGKDRIFGGSSNQPYITKDIPEGYQTLGAADNDFILRGGITAISESGKDVLRLGKMFIDTKSTSGIFFTIKQNLLSRTAARTQTSGILNEGIYTPLSTLVQAGVNFSGTHVNKQGLNPFAGTGATSNNDNLYAVRMRNYNIEAQFSPDGILKNRLFALYENKIQNNSIGFFGKVNNISFLPSEILSYGGGPGSILGIGNTNIKFSDQRTGINNPNYKGNDKPDETQQKDKYNPLQPGLKGITTYAIGASQTYLRQTGVNLFPLEDWEPETGKKLFPTNIYQSGSLNVNPLLINPSTNKAVPSSWTEYMGTEKYSGFTSGSKLITDQFDSAVSPFVVNNDLITSVVPEDQQKKWASTPDQTTDKYDASKVEGASAKFVQAFTASTDVINDVRTNNSVYNSGSTFPDGTNPANFDNGTVTYNQSMLMAETGRASGSFQDFRKIIRDNLGNTTVINNGKISGQLTNAPDYVTENVDIRTQQGQPGNRVGKNYSDYSKGVKYSDGKYKALDEINASAIGSPVGEWNDLVTFNIVPISGEGAMTFRAFLGSISDNYSANINTHQFVGRGENFYTYGGFDRKFSLSWTVYAQSKPELIPMYQKLSFLASNLAPIYRNGFMQGPLVKLSIGGYFRDMPGYITGLNYELTEDSTWDIQINTGDGDGIDKDTSQLPHMIKVSGFQFIPIPTYLPQQGAPMIDIWNGYDFNLAYSKGIASNNGKQYGQTIRGIQNKNSNGTYVP